MIKLSHLGKRFGDNGEIIAIDDINLTIKDGDVFGVIGLSGAGKSTLVRCINFLEVPTSGKVIFDGVDLGTLGHRQLLEQRRKMSMIFQQFNLLSQRSVFKNVMYPLEITHAPRAEAKEKAMELLETVGLSDKAKAYPEQLSGGQKQRVAIARALATDPKVLLCDECTSALDPNTTRSILELLKCINEEMGVTIIVITHEMKVIEQICNKVAVLDNSHIVEEGYVRDVFIAPKSEIARQLILPAGSAVSEIKGMSKIRIVFDGNSSFEPVISNLTLECRTPVNILGADTKDIEGRAFGQMLIQLPDDPAAQMRIRHYLETHSIRYEEVA